jgi:hypothetical protein
MSEVTPTVGGLVLPVKLVVAIEKGIWQPPADNNVLADVFGDTPESPEFYDLPAIDRQNRSWQAMSAETVFGDPIADQSLGIDPRQSVVIGDLGPDMPIALDYRGSRENPRVLYLGFSGVPIWREISRSFGELLDRLNIRTDS